MTNEDWLKVKHFTQNENWGRPEFIASELVFILDNYRTFIGQKIVVVSGTQGTHEQNSYHPIGLAVDIAFPDARPGESFDLWIAALRFDFQGVGYYPKIKFNGREVGGLHLDVRPKRMYKSLWVGVPSDESESRTGLVYYGASIEGLKKAGAL